MPLLVDVVNVLHVTGVLPPEMAGPDEAALAGMVARSRWAGDRVLLVCDGGIPGEQRPVPALDVVLRRTGSRSADDVIVEEAERSSYARRITIVTNDREILARTKPLGCRSLSADRFLALLAADLRRAERRGAATDASAGRRRSGREDIRLSPQSVEAWMRTFGFGAAPPSSE